VTDLRKASWLALLIPAALLGGALGSQYIGGLFPCEMCYWQRWPHEAAIAFALMALLSRDTGIRRLFVILAALAIVSSGLIGVFHAGVEYKWWDGVTPCTRTPGTSGGNIMADIMAAPLVSCNQPQWTLGPISLAGFNAIFSIGGGLLVLWMAGRRKA
jgi:disulfide bond formation protein DsbB